MKTTEEIILIFVEAWNKKDVSLLKSILREDFHYSSFWVYEEIQTAQAYLEYLSGKFQSIKSSGSIVKASKANSINPTVVIQQNNGEPIALIVQIENGLATRADMMPVDFVR